MNSPNKNFAAPIEAVLFSHGEALSIKKLASIIKAEPSEIESSLNILEQSLKERGSGLALIRKNNIAQLITAPKYGELISDLVKGEFQEDLTPAAQETLAIIAYSSPITRADIEHIRGANSSFTLRNLLMRGLIERSSNPDRANTFIYTISSDCLRHLGITRLEDLPEYEKYKTFAGKIFEQA